MKSVFKFSLTVVMPLFSFMAFAQNTYTINVTVTNVESNKGKVFLALYNSESSFLEKVMQGTTSKIYNNSCAVVFKNIPEGTYAVSIFHDENDNGKMDTNFVGIPKEDYGCSNNAKGFMGPPKWEDAKFELNANKQLTISL